MATTINNKDIGTEYQATLLSIDQGYSSVTTYYDWLRRSPAPIRYDDPTITYHTAIVRFLVEGDKLDENCSNLVSALVDEAEIKDTTRNIRLLGHLVDVKDNRICPKARELEIEFECEFLIQEDQENTFEETVTPLENFQFSIDSNNPFLVSAEIKLNNSSYELPQRVELTINGKEYILKNLQPQIAYKMDFINGILDPNPDFYEENWDFPKVAQGSNTVSCSHYVQIKLIWKDRWI